MFWGSQGGPGAAESLWRRDRHMVALGCALRGHGKGGRTGTGLGHGRGTRDWATALGHGTGTGMGTQHQDMALVALPSPSTATSVTSLRHETCPRPCHVPSVPSLSPWRDRHSGTPWISLMGRDPRHLVPSVSPCPHQPVFGRPWPPGRGRGSHCHGPSVPSIGGRGGSGAGGCGGSGTGVPGVPGARALQAPCGTHEAPPGRDISVVTTTGRLQRESGGTGPKNGGKQRRRHRHGAGGPGELREGSRGAPTPDPHRGSRASRDGDGPPVPAGPSCPPVPAVAAPTGGREGSWGLRGCPDPGVHGGVSQQL